VLTTGFKAEFGQASGAIVNVITKSGGNAFHGVGSLFHRNESFDSVNSLDPAVKNPLHLRRFDYSLAGGGPILKDRISSSARRNGSLRTVPLISSTRILAHRLEQRPSFSFCAAGEPTRCSQRSRATRNFFKLNEQFGRHQLVQEMNYTNEYARGRDRDYRQLEPAQAAATCYWGLATQCCWVTRAIRG